MSADRAEQPEVWADVPDDHEYPSGPWTETTVDVVTEQSGRHTVLPDGQVWVDPARAEQAQPGGYVPPEVGAPTWPRVGPWRVGTHYRIHVYEGDRPVATFHDPADAGRCVVAIAAEERLRADLSQMSSRAFAWRADRDRLRGVIAAAYVDLQSGRFDEALATLRVAGEQP